MIPEVTKQDCWRVGSRKFDTQEEAETYFLGATLNAAFCQICPFSKVEDLSVYALADILARDHPDLAKAILNAIGEMKNEKPD